MNIIKKTILAAVGAVLFTAAPAIASAERVYFLVGTRHVYRIGTYQYAHLEERQKIEQDYADGIAGDKDTYDKSIAGGADPAVEGPQFNKALEDLAVERDQRLGAIFENADYERDRHSQLRIEGDGPYQVIGINFHVHANVEVFDDFIVYAPWPGYVVVDRPYGWSYGVVYTPGVFFNLYIGWHAGFVSIGSPFFFGFVGHSGPIGVIGISRGPHGGFVSRGGLGRGGSFGGHVYNAGHAMGGSHYSAGRSSYSHGAAGSHSTGSSRYGGAVRTTSGSKYSSGHSTGSFGHSSPTSGTRSGLGGATGGSSYSHSSSGHATGSPTRSTGSSGSFGKGGSTSNAGTSSNHTTGSSGHSSGTQSGSGSTHSSGTTGHSSGGGSHKKG